jgi:hypothetical protein
VAARRAAARGGAPEGRRPNGGRRLLADFAPLRESRDFRLLFCGQTASMIGSQLTLVAIPYQMYLLTRSSLAVGLIGLVELAPLIAVSMVGGAVADAIDRRHLLVVAQLGLAAVSAGLAVNASAAHPSEGALYGLAGAAAGLSGLDVPTRRAIVPTLVRAELIPASAALNAVMVRSAQTVGPALSGLVIDRVSLSAAYWLDVVSFGAALAALAAMRALPPQGGGTPAGLHSIREGLRFLGRRPVLQGALVIDVNAMVFGMPRALFPALGTGTFGGGAGTVGLLYAAPAAGAFAAALVSGWVGGVRRQGRAVVISVLLWGAAIVAFGLVTWLPLALVLLAAAGAADIVSEVFRSTILQLAVPDALRGRLSAIFVAQVTGSPRLGDVEAGAVAALATPQISVVSGGLACMAGALAVARRWPELAAWTLSRPARGSPAVAAASPPGPS